MKDAYIRVYWVNIRCGYLGLIIFLKTVSESKIATLYIFRLFSVVSNISQRHVSFQIILFKCNIVAIQCLILLFEYMSN